MSSPTIKIGCTGCILTYCTHLPMVGSHLFYGKQAALDQKTGCTGKTGCTRAKNRLHSHLGLSVFTFCSLRGEKKCPRRGTPTINLFLFPILCQWRRVHCCSTSI